MSTVTRNGRTGYGNRAYARKPGVDSQQINGWVLALIGALAVFFLVRALRQQNGFAESWHTVIAMVLMETIMDTVKRFMINVASE